MKIKKAGSVVKQRIGSITIVRTFAETLPIPPQMIFEAVKDIFFVVAVVLIAITSPFLVIGFFASIISAFIFLLPFNEETSEQWIKMHKFPPL